MEIELAYAFPPLAVAGALLVLPHALATAHRLQGFILALGALLITALLCLVLAGDAISPFTLTYTTLAMLAACFTIAPLMDRARATGLLAASIAAAIALPYGLFHALPAMLGTIAPLLMLLVAACSAGLAGSQMLGHHRMRMNDAGQLRMVATPGVQMVTGWALLAALFALLSPAAPMNLLASALVAGIATLFSTRAEDGLQKTGEALAAGVLVASLAPVSVQAAALLGLLAALCVIRSEAFALRLRADDPHHLLGAVLLPAAAGLLAPGLINNSHLTSGVLMLGCALMLGLIFSAFVWPLIMLLVGLARPATARARIGVSAE